MAQKTCLTSLLMIKDITTFPAGALSLFLFGGTITNRGEHVEWENNKSIATSPRQQQRAGEMREASVIVRASHRSLIFFFLCRLREGGFRLFISRLLFPFSFLFFGGGRLVLVGLPSLGQLPSVVAAQKAPKRDLWQRPFQVPLLGRLALLH